MPRKYETIRDRFYDNGLGGQIDNKIMQRQTDGWRLIAVVKANEFEWDRGQEYDLYFERKVR